MTAAPCVLSISLKKLAELELLATPWKAAFWLEKWMLDFLGFSRVKRAFSKGCEATLRLTNCQDPHRQQPVEADAADG